MISNGEYYLITSDDFFVAPDGHRYQSAWGRCVIKTTDEVFGFVPQRPSTNWFCMVGKGENEVTIAGCHIHYAVKCDNRPVALEGEYPNSNGATIPYNNIFFTE